MKKVTIEGKELYVPLDLEKKCSDRHCLWSCSGCIMLQENNVYLVKYLRQDELELKIHLRDENLRLFVENGKLKEEIKVPETTMQKALPPTIYKSLVIFSENHTFEEDVIFEDQLIVAADITFNAAVTFKRSYYIFDKGRMTMPDGEVRTC